MRLQSTESNCGPASVANALKALGIKCDEDTVMDWINATRKDTNPADGNDQNTIVRAITDGPHKHRLVVRRIMIHDPALAVCALRGLLDGGSVALLAVDEDDHWLVAIGRLGDRFLLADAAEVELVLSVSGSQLLARWECPHDSGPAGFYMLVVSRGKAGR